MAGLGLLNEVFIDGGGAGLRGSYLAPLRVE